MDVSALLLELYGRIPPLAEEAVDGLDPDALSWAPADGANPIGWLHWHLPRVQDLHISELIPAPQVWEGDGWAARFGLEPDPDNHGYGHTPDDVRSVRPESAQALLDYLAAVDARARTFVGTVSSVDLERIVDDSWDPPVSLGVRLVRVADDSLQHVGQANYVRGLLGR